MGFYILNSERRAKMPITVKHGSKKSIPLMKELWREVFHDSDEFIDTFFSTFYRPRRTLLAFEGKELVSMLFCMDVGARYFRKKVKCAYLYGVATKLSERRRGHFRMLHERLIEELRARHYDAVLVMPAEDSLFNFYKDFGYTISLKRFEYALTTSDIEEVHDLSEIWQAKRELFKKSNYGLQVLETEAQFIESRKDHKFFRYGSSYLAFAKEKGRYVLYETICPNGEGVPVERTHYERSAQLYDLNGVMDAELLEKQKPELSYLLN